MATGFFILQCFKTGFSWGEFSNQRTGTMATKYMLDLFPHIRLTAQDLTYSYINGCRVPSPPPQLSLLAAQD